MSTTDAEWQAWAEKTAAEYSGKAMPELSRAGQLQELEAYACRKIVQEIARETVAYKSPARLRLYRLADFIEQWRGYGHLPDGHPDLMQDVVREFVALLEHMGLESVKVPTGGAT